MVRTEKIHGNTFQKRTLWRTPTYPFQVHRMNVAQPGTYSRRKARPLLLSKSNFRNALMNLTKFFFFFFFFSGGVLPEQAARVLSDGTPCPGHAFRTDVGCEEIRYRPRPRALETFRKAVPTSWSLFSKCPRLTVRVTQKKKRVTQS